MILDKPLDQITEADLQVLKDNAVSEGRTLDYKLELTKNSDDAKKEFLFDVTSFANAAGGYMIFGIGEQNGVPVEVTGLTAANPDAEILRLVNMMRDTIQPRLRPVGTQIVRLANGHWCLVMHIPRSWSRPHAVLNKKYLVFYSRNSAGKYPLDVPEVRDAFLSAGSEAERIRNFRAARIGDIVAGQTPVPVPETAKIVFHLVPIGAFGGDTIDASQLDGLQRRMHEMNIWGPYKRHNFDGLLFSTLMHPVAPGQVALNYAQVYRNGIIEAVDSFNLSNGGGPSAINGPFLEDRLLPKLPPLLQVIEVLEIEPPVLLFVTFLGVSGCTISATPGHFIDYQPYPIDRDALLMPDVLIETLADDPRQIMKPVFDVLWNSGGKSGSPSYNELGEWTRQQ